MIPLGDILLYASLAVSVIALVGLISREIKNIELLNKLVTPAIIAGAGLLTFSYILLTYYFVYSDFAYDYVWQYSSADLPLIYKISGTWAGQQGTYLLWVWVVYLSAAWLALTTKHKTALARRTQIITLLSGMYLIIITLVQSPFKLIIERPEVVDLIANGTLTPDFVPEAGNGLNALLVNFWMTVHPPLMFIGYATMTIPFAAAIVYLLTKEDGWEELGRQWARFTWLFLGMGSGRDSFIYPMVNAYGFLACCSPSQEEQGDIFDSCTNTCSGFIHTCTLCGNSCQERYFKFSPCFW